MREIDSITLAEASKQIGTYPIQLISLIIDRAENNWIPNHNYVIGDKFYILNNHYIVTSNFTSGNNFEIDNNIGNLNLYLTNCYKNITSDNIEYIAGAGLLRLSAVEETQEAQSTSINIELSAVPITLLSILSQTKIIGGEVNISQCFFNTQTNEIEENVYHKWSGLLSSYDHSEDNSSGIISVECKSIIGALMSGKNGRFTSNASIQKFNPSDLSASFISSMVDFNPNFGGEK